MSTENSGRILAAEIVGTTVLMLGGPGVAIFALQAISDINDPDSAATASAIVRLIVSLGFGLSLAIMAYVIGPISGCHINPAVTLGMLLTRKISATHAVMAWIGQLLGGIGGAAIIYGIASGRDDFQRGQFAANLWSGEYYGVGAAIVAEVVLTALLVLVVLSTTTRTMAPGMGGLVAGLTLTVIHLISIPIDNTSVNPARSIGTALFADTDFEALQQLWVFVVFPLVGAVVGVIVWLVLDEARLEDTMLAEVPGMADVRDALDRVADEAVDAVEDAVD